MTRPWLNKDGRITVYSATADDNAALIRSCHCCPCINEWDIVSTCACGGDCEGDGPICKLDITVSEGDNAATKYMVLSNWEIQHIIHSGRVPPITGTAVARYYVNGEMQAESAPFAVENGTRIGHTFDFDSGGLNPGSARIGIEFVYNDGENEITYADETCVVSFAQPSPLFQIDSEYLGPGDIYVIPSLLRQTAEDHCVCAQNRQMTFEKLKGPFGMQWHAVRVAIDYQDVLLEYARKCVCPYPVECTGGDPIFGGWGAGIYPEGGHEIVVYAGSDGFGGPCAGHMIYNSFTWEINLSSGIAILAVREQSTGATLWSSGESAGGPVRIVIPQCGNYEFYLYTSSGAEIIAAGVNGEHNILNLLQIEEGECEGTLGDEFAAVPNNSDEAGYTMEMASLYLSDMPERFV